MRIIKTDEQLRRYIPNAFSTASGETPFLEKIAPWLETAENWLFAQFIGEEFAARFLDIEETEPERIAASCIVALEALCNAVPSLDLVLTPNASRRPCTRTPRSSTRTAFIPSNSRNIASAPRN